MILIETINVNDSNQLPTEPLQTNYEPLYTMSANKNLVKLHFSTNRDAFHFFSIIHDEHSANNRNYRGEKMHAQLHAANNLLKLSISWIILSSPFQWLMAFSTLFFDSIRIDDGATYFWTERTDKCHFLDTKKTLLRIADDFLFEYFLTNSLAYE